MNYLKRFETCLIDPTWDEMVTRDPILAFSLYHSGRVNVLFLTAKEILQHLDDAFSEDSLRMKHFERADSLMWFWTLGAYEVVRTMCQAEACFSTELLKSLKNLKKTHADIRMPAAKMERMGKREPITSSLSPSGWSNKSKDILLFRSNPDDYLSGRAILDEFDDVFSSITMNDVLLSHEESYGRSA